MEESNHHLPATKHISVISKFDLITMIIALLALSTSVYNVYKEHKKEANLRLVSFQVNNQSSYQDTLFVEYKLFLANNGDYPASLLDVETFAAHDVCPEFNGIRTENNWGAFLDENTIYTYPKLDIECIGPLINQIKLQKKICNYERANHGKRNEKVH